MKRAYVLADNKLALNAGWDEEILAEELRALMEVDAGFSVEVTGFSIAEIDALVDCTVPEEPGDPAHDIVPDEAPDPVRHPDHIEIDTNPGEVVIKGPLTREEKARWHWLREQKAEFEQELAELRQLMRDGPDYEHREQVEADIVEDEKTLEMIRCVLPG